MLPDTLTEIRDYKHSKVKQPNPFVEAFYVAVGIFTVIGCVAFLAFFKNIIQAFM